jgi:hypothetical protein
MSIGASAIGEQPIGASATAPASASTAKTPRKRIVTARADVVQQPEPR